MRMILDVYDYVGLSYATENAEVFLLSGLTRWCVLIGVPLFGIVCLFGNVSLLLFLAGSFILFMLPPVFTMGFSEIFMRKWKK